MSPGDAHVEPVLERLAELGLDEAEARAYLYVSSTGPSKAGDIARGVGLPRGEAYRVLQRLVEREFVTASLSRPVQFAAVPVADLFGDVLDQERRRLRRLEESQHVVQDLLARLQSRGGPAGASSFKMLHGRRRILAVADRMLADDASRVDVAMLHPASRAWAGQWVPPRAHARVLARPGVRAVGAEAREADAEARVGLVVARGREVLAWVTHDPSERLHAEGDVAYWSDAPDLVDLHALLFDALWAKATPAPPPRP